MNCRSQYTRFANQCIDMADEVDGPLRDTLLEMAQTWL